MGGVSLGSLTEISTVNSVDDTDGFQATTGPCRFLGFQLSIASASGRYSPIFYDTTDASSLGDPMFRLTIGNSGAPLATPKFYPFPSGFSIRFDNGIFYKPEPEAGDYLLPSTCLIFYQK